MKEISYNKKGTLNIAMLGVANIFCQSPVTDVSGDFRYIKTINSRNISRKMIITKEKTKKVLVKNRDICLYFNISSTIPYSIASLELKK